MSMRSLSARIAFLLLALCLAVPAFAQIPEGIVRYRVVDDATGAESIARLELRRPPSPDRSGSMVITQFFPPETPGAAGTYKVFAGYVSRGGLGISSGRLWEAKDSFQMLQDPDLQLLNPDESLKPGFECRVQLLPADFPFHCFDLAGTSQTGRMIQLPPSPPPIPEVLREDLPGYYRVVDEAGEEGLARLEFHGVNPGSRALLTLLSRPEGPEALGTYKVFAGVVAPRAQAFRATVRELRDPYRALRRLALLPAVPEEALVPNFACNLSSPGGQEIVYHCLEGMAVTQNG